jgi:hypothetical protein
MIQDTMQLDDDEIEDGDVDKLIFGMEDEVKRKKAMQIDNDVE